MGMFKIIHIDRNGHTAKELICAKTKRLARLKAEEMFDDVIRVKRASFPWLRTIIIIMAIVAVAVLALR